MRAKVAVPIMEMHRAESEGFGVSANEMELCRDSLAALADDVGGRIDESSNCGWKMILPNTQSISGL